MRLILWGDKICTLYSRAKEKCVEVDDDVEVEKILSLSRGGREFRECYVYEKPINCRDLLKVIHYFYIVNTLFYARLALLRTVKQNREVEEVVRRIVERMREYYDKMIDILHRHSIFTYTVRW